jgi:hypothetical protein
MAGNGPLPLEEQQIMQTLQFGRESDKSGWYFFRSD